MGLLSDRELAGLLPAETHAFAGPIPTQSVSSDEFRWSRSIVWLTPSLMPYSTAASPRGSTA